MIFATPDDVAALQAEVKDQAKAITDSLAACIQAGTITTRSPVFQRWKPLVKRTARFLSEEPSWLDGNAQIARGHALQRDFQPMYDAIEEAKCTPPPRPSPPAPDPSLDSMLSGYGWLVALALGAFMLHEYRKA